MSEQTEKINIIELLMGIKEDVSSIKTDMANFKESQRIEREAIMKEITDVRADYQRDLASLESRVISKLNGLQSVQNNLVGDVDTLKHAEEKKDAKRYRTVIAFVLTAVGGMLLAKLPDFISWCILVGGNK
jgi:hypothetical protein